MLASDELKRRIDALRTLRGLTQSELAEIVRRDGFGKHDVGRLERGDIALTLALRRSLAEHLRVPEAWFSEPDLDKVIDHAATPAEGLAELQVQVAEFRVWAEDAVDRMLDYRTETFGRVLERLEQIDRRLAQIDEIPARVTGLEKTLEPIVELAVMRAASDFAAAAEQQEPGEAPGASQDTGRRRPGRGAADQ